MPKMSLLLYVMIGVQFWLASSFNLAARDNTSGFVSVRDGSFELNASPFRFYGTNAYWMQMATDGDLEVTFHDIATAGFSVVRVWAFNDVVNKPSSGPYFQILKDGKATINEGVDGLQRLDQVVATAEKYGIKLLLTLSNNWNPERPEPSSSFSRRNNNELPRGYLSNDYGSMDTYIRAFHPNAPQTHDLFYTDPNIVGAFKNYLSHVIPRYAQNPTVLGWELGSDLRCASTLPASSSCNATTITKWAADISSYVKKLDSQHIITAGDGGFYCLGCPKSFAKECTKPRSPLTGPSFDGSYGVDTEDIMAIPTIDFGSFQFFPDQTAYFTTTNGDTAATAIGHGGSWISVHSNSATLLGKPEVLTAAAIVTKAHWSSFVPFTGTAPPPEGSPCGGVESFQQDYAFTSWATSALNSNIGGVLEYMWLQNGLTSHGTTHRRRELTMSPQDGGAHYNGDMTNQTLAQVALALPPI